VTHTRAARARCRDARTASEAETIRFDIFFDMKSFINLNSADIHHGDPTIIHAFIFTGMAP
jgi:hypothetical protein